MSICKLGDRYNFEAELMRLKLEGKPLTCPKRGMISYPRLDLKLKRQGVKVLMLHLVEYRSNLNFCQKCENYDGEYPEEDSVRYKF